MRYDVRWWVVEEGMQGEGREGLCVSDVWVQGWQSLTDPEQRAPRRREQSMNK